MVPAAIPLPTCNHWLFSSGSVQPALSGVVTTTPVFTQLWRPQSKMTLLAVTPVLGQFWPLPCDFSQIGHEQLFIQKNISGDHRGPDMLHLPFLNEWIFPLVSAQRCLWGARAATMPVLFRAQQQNSLSGQCFPLQCDWTQSIHILLHPFFSKKY